MKSVNLIIAGCLLLSATFFSSCGEKDETVAPIVVQDNASLTQTVFADDTQGAGSVSFVTAGAWSSSIAETATTKAATVDWISISPNSGDRAGSYTVTVILTVNTTGADRTAVITIACEGTEVKIAVTQKKTKADGSELLSVTELIALGEQAYISAHGAYMQIDSQYSTQTARQGITASSGFLLDYWQKSYDAIGRYNSLLENLDRHQFPSDEEKSLVEGTALARRSQLYFYLNTLYTGVPLLTNTETSLNEIPRNSVSEVNDFVRAHLDEATLLLPQSVGAPPKYLTITRSFDAHFVNALQALQANDVSRARDRLNGLRNDMQSGNVGFYDSNQDGIFDGIDRPYNIMTAQIYLLSAELSLNAGDTGEARELINTLYQIQELNPPVSQGATTEEVRTAIRTAFANWDTGIKFLNTMRWGETAQWGHYASLPIPVSVMAANPNMMQNPGWYE
ncbi:MAG: RagB/SusD family nutrient uptake outer membrane protein [Bacteroidales bacterium]|jgi:hypothetical protein|nr:RagB/SusD family nutrient uptake outer membrane protein [Bacteroidales bacterium]